MIGKQNSSKMRRVLIIFLCCVTLTFSACSDSATSNNKELQDDVEMLAQEVLLQTPEASIGSVNGDWAVIGLACSKADVPDNYFDIYYDNIRAYVKSKDGVLSNDTYTEYARVSLALIKIGKDPEDVEGYNLIEPLDDYDKVIHQGINGPAYALVAANAAGVKLNSQEKYIEYILDQELEEGGFSFNKEPDPGITAMVLQGLAPYKEMGKVNEAIERSLLLLSKLQNEEGSFDGGSETVSQIILALCALDINPEESEDFTKNSNTLCDTLMEYEIDGGLSHEKAENSNPMATEQGLYALSQVSAFN